jgi:hypothetical protein
MLSTRRPQYYRFEMLTQDPETGLPEGLFVRAGELLQGGELPGYYHDLLDNLMSWFAKNLDRPTRFSSSTSKGADRRVTKGVSWYKDTSHQHIAKMREMSAILVELGHSVNERATRRPGYIVYEDEIQIVAEPFSENV